MTVASANKKWTDEAADSAENLYVKEGKSPDEIAEILGGYTPRQVIGKLVSRKVYKAPEKPEPQPRDPGPTKAETRKLIEDNFDLDMSGSENASKDFLERLRDYLKATVTSE